MTVNGEELSLSVLDNPDIVALLNYYKLDSTRVAVELNGQVLKKSDYVSTSIADSDKIEIIHFVGGGN